MATDANGSATATDYTIYHNYYSICSIQSRYVLKVRGKAANAGSEMLVQEQEVDIFNEEQLSEDYLIRINPKGQVPVLASPEAFSFPLAHTAAITEYIADRHPSLLPSAHRNEIKRMVTKMHELNFFTLSFSGSPGAAAPDSPPPIVKRLETPILERLEREDISEEYRKALEYKLSISQREKFDKLAPSQTEIEVKRATAYLEEVASMLRPDHGQWLFGEQRPTALDANLVPLIARLQAVGKDEIVPRALKRYGEMAMNTPEWKDVMQDRPMMYPGPAASKERERG